MGIFKVKGSPHYHFAFSVKGFRYRGSTRTDKKSDAETIYANQRRKVLLGECELDALTLEEAFAKYEEEHAMFLNSYDSVRPRVNAFLNYFGKSLPLHGIGQNEMERCIAKFRTETYTRSEGGEKKKLTAATINRRIATFQCMHNKATKSWKVRTQPIEFKDIKLKERTIMNNTLPIGCVQKLFNAAPEHLKHFIMISLYTGWRKANVLSLNGKEQINLSNLTIATIGKGGKSITSPISESFERYIIANDLHKKKIVCEYHGCQIRDIKTAWHKLFKRTKIKYIRPHDLRHTFGTWLYESTGDQRLVQELLHHSDIKTSVRYTHTKQDIQRQRLSNAIRLNVKQVKAIK